MFLPAGLFVIVLFYCLVVPALGALCDCELDLLHRSSRGRPRYHILVGFFNVYKKLTVLESIAVTIRGFQVINVADDAGAHNCTVHISHYAQSR